MVDQLKGAINYLYKPAELGADAVAFMQDPARLKKMYLIWLKWFARQ